MLQVPCEKGAFRNTTFILHTDCVPDDVKAKDPEFWAHMPIQRAYVVRHNFGEGGEGVFSFFGEKKCTRTVLPARYGYFS